MDKTKARHGFTLIILATLKRARPDPLSHACRDCLFLTRLGSTKRIVSRRFAPKITKSQSNGDLDVYRVHAGLLF
jgi:hypothetical protein